MYESKLRNDRRVYRVNCTQMLNGKFNSIEECQISCVGDMTYGCNEFGECRVGLGNFAKDACKCYDCKPAAQSNFLLPPTCSSKECLNTDTGPCYASNKVCYAANLDGTCPGSTILCPSTPVLSECVLVGNTGKYINDCGTACSPSPACPVGASGLQCNGTGSCQNGTCVCNTGWIGADCGTPSGACPGFSDASGACNGNGTCNKSNWTCLCNTGWIGVDCSMPTACPGFSDANGACNGNGTCNKSNWTCLCNDGWIGAGCDQAIGAVPSAGPLGYPNVSVYWGQNWADPDFGLFTKMPWVGRVIISFALATGNVRLFDLPGVESGSLNPSMPINLGWNANFCSRYNCSGVSNCGIADNIMYNCTLPDESGWEGKAGFPNTYPQSFGESSTAGTNVNAGLAFAPLPTSITKVQEIGTEVLISIGGAVGTLPADQTSAEFGPKLLQALRTQFLDLPGLFRPFGDVVLDGIDLDFEPMAHGDWFFAFLDAWDAQKMGRRTGGKGFVLTAAPESAITPASLFFDLLKTDSRGNLINLSRAAQIDCFQYQFYNTDYSCFGCKGDPSSATYFSTGKQIPQDWNMPGDCNPCPYSPNPTHPLNMGIAGDGFCVVGKLVSYLQLFDSIAFQCNQWRQANGYSQIQKFQVGVPAPPTINSEARANKSSIDHIFGTQLKLQASERVSYWKDQMNKTSSQLATLFPLHFQGLMLWDAAGDTGPFFVAEPGTLGDVDEGMGKSWTGGVRATVGADVQLSGLIARSMELIQGTLPTTFPEWSTKLATLINASTFNHGVSC